MKTIEQVENFSDRKFHRTFGVSKITFATMISILQKQYEKSHKKGRRPPKVTTFDRLCIFFAYYRDGRTIANIANEYSLAESTIFDVIRLVEYALLKENIEVAVVDANEFSIQHPKKNREVRTKIWTKQKISTFAENLSDLKNREIFLRSSLYQCK